MPKNKTIDLSNLVVTKGNAIPITGVTTRTPVNKTLEPCNVPLNFRVSADFRRRFKVFAASHDLKQNELLQIAFDEYEKNH